MHVHHGVGRFTRSPEGIPVVGVDAREPEGGRSLAEADGVAAQRRASFDLGRGDRLSVVQRSASRPIAAKTAQSSGDDSTAGWATPAVSMVARASSKVSMTASDHGRA